MDLMDAGWLLGFDLFLGTLEGVFVVTDSGWEVVGVVAAAMISKTQR